MAGPFEVTDQNFDEFVQKHDKAVIDCWAAWCGPCKMVGPVVEELAKEYEGKVKIAQMDVDQNRQTPARFGIRNIPTLILFKGGEIAKRFVGVTSKKDLQAALDAAG